MLVFTIYGTYYFGQKLTAFRNDLCRHCKVERVAFQYRAFEVGHVFWLPVLPKGVWRRWVCSRCGNDPHAQAVSNGIKWVGIVLLGLLALSAWVATPKAEDATGIWAMRVGLPVVAVALWRSIAQSRRALEMSRAIQPYGSSLCPACGSRLVTRSRGRACIKCGAVQQDLRAA